MTIVGLDAYREHRAGIVDALAEEFIGVFSRETVAELTDDTAKRWSEARIGLFVPTFVHRFARQRLLAVAKTEGKIVTDRPEVLFVCVQNAGRSQMAAALLDHHAEGRVVVRSAGSQPAEEIHPPVVTVMDELGLDLTRSFPKPLTDDAVRASDVVITMGCGDACPVFPGKRYLDWELPDPSGRPLDAVREIRDEIDRRVRDLLADLVGDSAVEEEPDR